MEKLIFKYLNNELNKSEAAELKQWLETDSVNRKVFENIVGEWNLSSDDIKASQIKIFDGIVKNGSKRHQEVKIRSFGYYFTRIAAVLVLTISIATIILYSDHHGTEEIANQSVLIEKEAENGQRLTFTLPDGSIVKLNAGSKLTFPRAFEGSRREVSLVGEAYFDVKRDISKPFEISSGPLHVKVLGTTFNVRSYPSDEEMNVAVRSGKVEVVTEEDLQSAILNPLDMVVYNRELQSLQSQVLKDPLTIFGWTDQQLVFQNNQIDEVFRVMGRWFDVTFETRKLLNTKTEFTGKYKNPSLKEVMESLSYAFEFEYEINEKNVIIK